MEVAEHQLRREKHFAFEHPMTASSWKLDAVEKISNYDQVGKAHFDQCMLGLKSPSGKLFKKRTTVMSNHSGLLAELAQYQCNRAHDHQPIIGQEKGRSRSWWAQHYPPRNCARFWLVLQKLHDKKRKLLLLHVFWHWDSSRLRCHCESCQGPGIM